MEAVRMISITTIRARSYLNHGDSTRQIDLNPWDLQYLVLGYAQKGLLFHRSTSSSSSIPRETMIQHLRDSLSSTLDFFLPLAGRLLVVPHGREDGTSSVFITCNNAGVSFVHGIADNTTIADILEPTYVPRIVSSFFPARNIKNFEATRVPLVAVQVTELVDGIFIACSMNHCLADVKPYWNFLNAWAQISRNRLKQIAPNSKLASFERWFPHGKIERPIAIPFRKILQHHLKESTDSIQSPPFSRRIFHFKREKIAELKAKTNSEIEDGAISNKISSLQAVLGRVWRSVIKNQNLNTEEEVTYRFLISARSRVSHPPILDNYFGITVQFNKVTMKVRELVGDGGLGKFGWQMNKAISSCTEEKIKSDFEAWVRNPTIRTPPGGTIGKFMITASSPRTNFYDIDFGWGRPVAVRGGSANAKHWKLTVDAGAEEGSFDVELCASHEILEALAKDAEFMRAVESSSPAELLTKSKVARSRL